MTSIEKHMQNQIEQVIKDASEVAFKAGQDNVRAQVLNALIDYATYQNTDSEFWSMMVEISGFAK